MVAPNPVAFTLFGLPVMWYGVLIGTGMILGCSIAYMRAPKYDINPDNLLDVLIAAVVCGVIGARIYYVVFKWEYYAGDIKKILNVRGGGLAIHGGLIFGCIAILIVTQIHKMDRLNVLDLCAPSVALGQAIGRWGNFCNEEAHGGPTDFPINVLIDGQTYHATFLYESVWCFILFAGLVLYSKRRKFKGQIVCLYGMLYSVERFLVEGLRTDSLMIGPLRQAQVISLVIFAGCLAVYIILSTKHKRLSLTA